MVKRVILPSEALDDVRTLIQLSNVQLSVLDQLFSKGESAFPLRASFINEVAEQLKVNIDDARSVVVVCHFLLRKTDANEGDEYVTDLLADFREFLENSVDGEERQSLLAKFDENREVLASLAAPKPEPLRVKKIRRLERGPEPYIQEIRTICQLRPLFEGAESDESIAGLIPTLVLEIEAKDGDGDSKTFAFSMASEDLAKIEQVIQRTRDKLDAIRAKYGSALLTVDDPSHDE